MSFLSKFFSLSLVIAAAWLKMQVYLWSNEIYFRIYLAGVLQQQSSNTRLPSYTDWSTFRWNFKVNSYFLVHSIEFLREQNRSTSFCPLLIEFIYNIFPQGWKVCCQIPKNLRVHSSVQKTVQWILGQSVQSGLVMT